MSNQKSDRARRTQEAIERALRLADRIAQGNNLDIEIRDKLQNMEDDFFDYNNQEYLCIEPSAWNRVIEIGIKPLLVFAHPDVMKQVPESSLHYRGLALLSRKRVSEIAGNIDAWEQGGRARITDDKALKLARLYNTVISCIIIDNIAWTFENGYRNILATIGITEDGSIRNYIGSLAERSIKERILKWVIDHNLLLNPSQINQDIKAGSWELVCGVLMKFSSEPDIVFMKAGDLAVMIEIKGGKDPAGALERLGAIKKTFDESPIGCKNFLIVGVVTNKMGERLSETRLEKYFLYDEILDKTQYWEEFMNEIFHHALRIV